MRNDMNWFDRHPSLTTLLMIITGTIGLLIWWVKTH